MNDHVLRREAVERAYRDHADDVYRIALAILHDPDAAVDATHDTFARAFERWEQYDANRPLRAWLHGIVSHAALDQVRRRTVRTRAMPIVGRILEMPVASAGDHADPALEIAQRDLIAGALAGLKPDARAALVLRHYYGHYYGYDYRDAGGPLEAVAALGRRVGQWIAPPVAAKSQLLPGMVLSPDGTRVYAIGVSSPGATDRGSSGIFAFDASSLARLGSWAPTADFASIAVSADGLFVYAAAQGGIDAAGRTSPNGSSVTVFDTSDGSVRLIAGALGSSDLWFANSTLR